MTKPMTKCPTCGRCEVTEIKDILRPFIQFLNFELPCKDAYQQQRLNLEIDNLATAILQRLRGGK